MKVVVEIEIPAELTLGDCGVEYCGISHAGVVDVSCELDPKLIGETEQGLFVALWPIALRQMTDIITGIAHERLGL